MKKTESVRCLIRVCRSPTNADPRRKGLQGRQWRRRRQQAANQRMTCRQTDNRYSASPLDRTFGLRAEFQIGWQKSTMKILRHEGFAFHMVPADTDANGNVAAFLSFSHSNSTNPEIRSHFILRVSSCPPPCLKGKSTHPPPLPPIPPIQADQLLFVDIRNVSSVRMTISSTV